MAHSLIGCYIATVYHFFFLPPSLCLFQFLWLAGLKNKQQSKPKQMKKETSETNITFRQNLLFISCKRMVPPTLILIFLHNLLHKVPACTDMIHSCSKDSPELSHLPLVELVASVMGLCDNKKQ